MAVVKSVIIRSKYRRENRGRDRVKERGGGVKEERESGSKRR
jgi:hypothetical protein